MQLHRREAGSIPKIVSVVLLCSPSPLASSLLHSVPVCISPKPVGRNMT